MDDLRIISLSGCDTIMSVIANRSLYQGNMCGLIWTIIGVSVRRIWYSEYNGNWLRAILISCCYLMPSISPASPFGLSVSSSMMILTRSRMSLTCPPWTLFQSTRSMCSSWATRLLTCSIVWTRATGTFSKSNQEIETFEPNGRRRWTRHASQWQRKRWMSWVPLTII